MSKLTVTIEGDDADDPSSVFELIKDQILGGFTSGSDRRDGSSYEYSLDEESK